MRLFPNIKDFSNASIFDKNFYLNAIFNACSLNEYDALAESKQFAPYQISTN